MSNDPIQQNELPMSVVFYKIEDLRPNPKNPRVHKPDQIERIAKSMIEFGWTAPVLVGADNELVAGHGRLEAAKLIWGRGVSFNGSVVREIRNVPRGTVPAILLEDLTPVQIRALLIADNRLAELSTWDNPLLFEFLNDLATENFDLKIIGFDDFKVPGDEEGETEKDFGNRSFVYAVKVECEDETQQRELSARLEAEGYKCQLLIL